MDTFGAQIQPIRDQNLLNYQSIHLLLETLGELRSIFLELKGIIMNLIMMNQLTFVCLSLEAMASSTTRGKNGSVTRKKSIGLQPPLYLPSKVRIF